jgi:hypothetical protein
MGMNATHTEGDKKMEFTAKQIRTATWNHGFSYPMEVRKNLTVRFFEKGLAYGVKIVRGEWASADAEVEVVIGTSQQVADAVAAL